MTWALESSVSNLNSIAFPNWDEQSRIANKALKFPRFFLLTYVYYYDNIRQGMYLGRERKRHAARRWCWAEQYRRPNTVSVPRHTIFNRLARVALLR